MYLPQRDQGPRVTSIRAQPGEERRAIAFDRGLRVGFGESKIECLASVGAGVSPLAGGEAVNQPAVFLERLRLKDCDFGFRGDPGWHGFILSRQVTGLGS